MAGGTEGLLPAKSMVIRPRRGTIDKGKLEGRSRGLGRSAHLRWIETEAAGFLQEGDRRWSRKPARAPLAGSAPVHPRRRAGAPWMRLDVANHAVVATSVGSAKVRRIDDGRRSSAPTHGHIDGGVPVVARRREVAGCARLDLVKGRRRLHATTSQHGAMATTRRKRRRLGRRRRAARLG
jgi:hypothetical protein